MHIYISHFLELQIRNTEIHYQPVYLFRGEGCIGDHYSQRNSGLFRFAERVFPISAGNQFRRTHGYGRSFYPKKKLPYFSYHIFFYCYLSCEFHSGIPCFGFFRNCCLRDVFHSFRCVWTKIGCGGRINFGGFLHFY